jgi:hypothetical protein
MSSFCFFEGQRDIPCGKGTGLFLTDRFLRYYKVGQRDIPWGTLCGNRAAAGGMVQLSLQTTDSLSLVANEGQVGVSLCDNLAPAGNY